MFTQETVAGGSSLRLAFRPSPAEIFKAWLSAMLFCLMTAGAAIGQASCPIESAAIEEAKPNKIYLYFPTVSDNAFPPTGCTPGTAGCFLSPLSSGHVKPLEAFDISLLSSYTGTVDALRDQIRDVVIDDYCEINAKVMETTTAPPSTFPRRVVVGIGTDTASTPLGSLWGEAQEVDTADAIIFDAARVWAGTYQSTAGGPGGALNGANSTLQRWAFSIGGTAAHEAGHTFGLAHSDDFCDDVMNLLCTFGDKTKPGEDPVFTHLMPAGSHISNEQRADFRRHFSDATFAILASNIGLSVETIHNWDFTNPNSGPASQLQVELLSQAATLTLSWSYNGNMSPWVSPSITSSGTATFKGMNYNRFLVTWSAGQAWANGTPGVVPGGANFHVGVTFSEADFSLPDAVIVSKVTLLDGGGTPLELQPRMVAYDTGTLDAADGAYAINFFTADDPSRPLLLGNLSVSELPRVASIDSMVKGLDLKTWQGLPIKPWKSELKLCEKNRNITTDGCFVPLREARSVVVATLRQGRHIVEKYDGKCPPGLRNIAADASKGPDGNDCPNAGINVDLFPATTIYITATVVDPNAKHWDPASKSFVVGPVESRLFYQIAGRHPDLNRNGIDDFIDIATGTSKDTNGDGVPDEVQRCLKELRILEACELERGNRERVLADLRRREGLFPACEKSCSGHAGQERCLRDCGLRLAALEHQEHEENEAFHSHRERCEEDLQSFRSCEQRKD
jgi:hypothetical protein